MLCSEPHFNESAALQQPVKNTGTGTHNITYRFQHFLILYEQNCPTALIASRPKNLWGNRCKSVLLL